MDSTHVGSTASVSKAVSGVLTMRMVEQGLLDLDDETRDWVPTMPAQHTHTVGALLANRGCIRHYVSGLDGFTNQAYATALDAAEEFWDDPLVCDPDDEDYNYSTHGYTLLGAALEAAGNDDIKDLLRTKLTNPFGLGTLGPQNFSSSVHRMSIYTTNDVEVSTPNNDWKVEGGGVDSSVADLGLFGAKLVGGQILSDDSLDDHVDPVERREQLRLRLEHRDRGRHPGRRQGRFVDGQPRLPAAVPGEGHLRRRDDERPVR